MTPEQVVKLQALSEKLFEVVVVEVDPASWSGDGKRPRDMTKDERGDAVWCRRQAAASLALLTQVQRLTHSLETGMPIEPSTDIEDLDQAIALAEKDAGKLIKESNKHIARIRLIK